MHWRVALVVLLMLGPAACDEDPAAPTVAREQVAGTYDITVLSFDPQGAVLEKRSIVALLPPADRPELNVSGTNNTAQLVFRDPVTQFVTLASATYRLREFGIELTFQNAADAERILLPRRVNLTLSALSPTLQFTGDVTVPLARLQELVPEWQEVPLVDPVPGSLHVAFTRRQAEEEGFGV